MIAEACVASHLPPSAFELELAERLEVSDAILVVLAEQAEQAEAQELEARLAAKMAT